MEAEVNITQLLDLPSEIIVTILLPLRASDLCSSRLTCSQLCQLVNDERIWRFRAKEEFGAVLNVGNGSARLLYQLVLHKFGKLAGLWQRQNLHFYSGLLNVYFDNVNNNLVFEDVIPGVELERPMLREKFITIGVENTEDGTYCLIRNHDNMTVTQDVRIDIGNSGECEDKFEIILKNCQDHTLSPKDWRELLNQFLTKHGTSSDELGVLKFTTSFHSRSLFSFKRLLSPTPIPGAPIRPGLFKGTYGAHGIELIKLELTHAGMDEAKGVKVTGDPNVPFGEISFLLEDDRCLDIPPDHQMQMEDLNNVFDNPEFVAYKEDLLLPFRLPHDCIERTKVDYRFCKGRWKCKCQVSPHGFVRPSMIAGNFVVFTEDIFGVIFIDLRSISLFYRVSEL